MTRLLMGVASMVLLGGCASVNPRPAFDDVRKTVAERSRLHPEWTRTRAEASAAEQAVAKLLADPLTVDAAVHIAFLNNPTLQATFEEVGISQAELAQAARVEPRALRLRPLPERGLEHPPGTLASKVDS